MGRTLPAGSHLVRSRSPIIIDGSPNPTIRFNSTSFGLLFLIIRLEEGGPYEAVRFVKPLIAVCVTIKISGSASSWRNAEFNDSTSKNVVYMEKSVLESFSI
ncbi:hypothetical protein AVEN_57063-1 [Araneus ventricosus]|uniref:Uncharacterized protein n=1 Tax=Araneus ventricosus TaxID=182803 RepID=A0A4Y2G1R8_ARAVE|nr:hypothetical protein AVEN_57063-1 [Araneus ventricosus]